MSVSLLPGRGDNAQVCGRVQPTVAPDSPLTERQASVLAAVANGQTTAEIAASLWITPVAARTLVYNARIRLGARTRSHAIALALINGWLEVVDATRPPISGE